MAANLSFIISAIDEFSKTFDTLNSKIDQAYDAAGTMGAGMAAAGAGVAAGLGFAINTAANFEQAMSKVEALTGATGDQFNQLRDTALNLGASTSKSASEVATAMQDMAAKGFDVNEIIASMPGVIAAAEASGEDLALTSNVVASALNGFGLEASSAGHVADVLAMAANQSAASVDDMGYAFKYAATPAAMLGVSMEEIAVATGLMTDAGLEGSQAGTSLRMAMLRLADPPKEAAAALKSMGVEVFNADGTMKSMVDVIGEFQTGMQGMTQEQKVAALAAIFGAEAVSGMMTVLNTAPEKFAELQKGLETSGGSAAATAAIMRDNLKGAIEEMGGAMETAHISIGTALIPAIQWLTVGITNLVNWFNSLSPTAQRFVTIGAAVGAAFMLISGFVLILVSMIPNVVAGFAAIATALGTTAGALAVTIGWIGLIIAAVVAIGATLVWAYNNVGWFRDAVNSAWASIKDTAITTWNMLKSAVSSGITFIQSILGAAMPALQVIWQAAWFVIKYLVISTIEAIKNVINGGLKVIQGLITFFSGLFTGNFSKMWEGIKTLFSGAIQFIWGIINLAFVGRILKAGALLFSGLRGIVTGGWAAIRGFFSSSTASIGSIFSGSMNFLRNLTSNTFGTIANVMKSLVNGSVSAVRNSFNAMRSAVSSVMSGIRNVISSAWNGAVGFLKSINLASIGRNIIQGLVNGIGAMSGAIGAKIKSITNSIPAAVKKLLGIHSPSRVLEKLGGFTGEGLAVGIGDTVRMIEKSATQMAAAAVPEIGTTSTEFNVIRRTQDEGSGDDAAGSGGSGSGDEQLAPVNVGQLVVREEADIRKVAEELYKLQRRGARAKGNE